MCKYQNKQKWCLCNITSKVLLQTPFVGGFTYSREAPIIFRIFVLPSVRPFVSLSTYIGWAPTRRNTFDKPDFVHLYFQFTRLIYFLRVSSWHCIFFKEEQQFCLHSTHCIDGSSHSELCGTSLRSGFCL